MGNNMATGIKQTLILVLVGIAVLMLAVTAYRFFFTAEQTAVTKESAAPQQPITPMPPVVASAKSAPVSVEPIMPTPLAERVQPSINSESNSEALQSMQNSLSQGDSRTPELAPQFEREKPAPDVIADPGLYAEYELAQTKKVAAIYLSMLGQIPVLRARIDAAKSSGSKSADDIAEAEEALAQLEALKREMEEQHPDMLQTLSSSSDIPKAIE